MPPSGNEILYLYNIVESLGLDEMGEVGKARSSTWLRSERFEREASAIAGLNNPHNCSLYEVAPNDLAMEYVGPLEVPRWTSSQSPHSGPEMATRYPLKPTTG